MKQQQTNSFVVNKRRSQRIVARILVRVLRGRGANAAIAEHTHTVAVGSHGALLTLMMPVRHGEALTLQNPSTNEEITVRVIRIHDDRVPKEIAVEFTKQSRHFWNIDFPSADLEEAQP